MASLGLAPSLACTAHSPAPDGAGAGGTGELPDPAGTLTVDTGCGLVSSDTCPGDPATDGKCGLEEAVLALRDQKSEYGCTWSGTMGLNNTILLPASGFFRVTTTLDIASPVTIRSSQAEKLATIALAGESNLFGVTPMSPMSITFRDLHLLGPGQWLDAQSTGISVSGETSTGVAKIEVQRCWIEQFSNGGIVASDVTLTVSDSTLEHNSNDYGDGGGGIFYSTAGDAKSQVDSLTVTNSSITHNHSTKGAGLQIQSNSVARIINSTIADNLTDGGHGGGISFGNNAGPLTDGVLSILGSTIAFNGTTMFEGGGVAVGANQALFTENVNNRIHLVGSVVANNCFAQVNSDFSFTCTSPSDVFGDIYRFQDSLLGNSLSSNIIGVDQGGEGREGATWVDVDAGLEPQLTDQGGVGEHHPRVHALTADSLAIDATAALKTVNGVDAAHQFDQTHQLRGFDHLPAGPKVFDLGAVERRSNP